MSQLDSVWFTGHRSLVVHGGSGQQLVELSSVIQYFVGGINIVYRSVLVRHPTPFECQLGQTLYFATILSLPPREDQLGR